MKYLVNVFGSIYNASVRKSAVNKKTIRKLQNVIAGAGGERRRRGEHPC